MEQLEEKNTELQIQFYKQSTIKSTSKPSYSSPKRSHRCSSSCSSHKYKKSKIYRLSNAASLNSSDECLEDSSINGLNNDSQTADESVASRDHVSMEYLRSNDRCSVKCSVNWRNCKEGHELEVKVIKISYLVYIGQATMQCDT